MAGDDAREPLRQLPPQHLQAVAQAVQNVLSSEIAEETYAQIIDGLPLSHVATDVYEGSLCPGHFDLMRNRPELSPGVVERARQLRATFDAGTIKANPQVLHAFQVAAPGSRAFNTRLVELVAVAVHQIAGWLLRQEPVLPPDHPMVAWRPPPRAMKNYPEGYPPTLFRHEWYQCYEQYPEGQADMVGFWAESRIFGGVVLFDRRAPDSCPEAEPDAIYLHPDRRDVTYRIIKLTDEQKHSLLQYLLSDTTPPPTCPLPILADASNRQRVDPEEIMEWSGIYRDLWERKPLEERGDDRRFKDVMDTFNFLSADGYHDAVGRAIDMWERIDELTAEPPTEEELAALKKDFSNAESPGSGR